MNIIITGITGFAGSHLAEYLLGKGHGVRGLGAPRDSLHNLDSLISSGSLEAKDVLLADLEDRAVLEHLLDPAPDFVYHLAAQASVPRSWENPKETFRINVMGTLTLLSCLRELRPSPRMLYVGSADVYGASDHQNCLIAEDVPVHPLNPYALSKASAESLCQQAFQRDGLPIIRVRAFNHIGPRQGLGFAAADFASQITKGEINADLVGSLGLHARLATPTRGCATKSGETKPIQIRVGKLDALRDFTDVRDIVKAYELAITQGESGAVYNVCSGIGRTLQELLDGLLALSPISFEVIPDKSLMRPTEIPWCVGSNRLLVDTTGWYPQILWTQTLSDILDDHRHRAKSQAT